MRNLGKKVLALILAVSLWFIANMEQDVERTISIDVIYENLPQDLVIVNKPADKITITARGARGQIISLSPKRLRYSIDLSSISPGLSKFEVHAGQLKVPRGVQIVGITPAEIRVDVDRVVDKMVPVKPVLAPPDTGYEIVDKPVVEPQEVRVQGPSRIMYNLKSISTDTVSTSGVKSKFTIEVPLKAPPFVELVNPQTVRVTVDVRERVSVKEFKNVEIEFVNFEDLDYRPTTRYSSDIVFEGPYNIIKDLSSDNIRVYVDGKDIERNTKKKKYTLDVRVVYPFENKITLKGVNPSHISISLN
jgi:YbbR domain-containing protein